MILLRNGGWEENVGAKRWKETEGEEDSKVGADLRVSTKEGGRRQSG